MTPEQPFGSPQDVVAFLMERQKLAVERMHKLNEMTAGVLDIELSRDLEDMLAEFASDLAMEQQGGVDQQRRFVYILRKLFDVTYRMGYLRGKGETN